MKGFVALLACMVLAPAAIQAAELQGQWENPPDPNPAQVGEMIQGVALFTFTPVGKDKDELDYWDAHTSWDVDWLFSATSASVQHNEVTNDSTCHSFGQGKFLDTGMKTIRCTAIARVVKEGYQGDPHVAGVLESVLVTE